MRNEIIFDSSNALNINKFDEKQGHRTRITYYYDINK